MNEMRVEDAVLAITRPDAKLMKYYFLTAIVSGPAFPIVLTILYFRYHTMRYKFTDEGVTMRWGILFRKEINLTFARIQDIHLVSNFAERWLGLAKIAIQTASGSAAAEMTIEGVLEYEALRNFLYTRMRGAKGLVQPSVEARTDAAPHQAPHQALHQVDGMSDVASTLKEAVAELKALRLTIESQDLGQTVAEESVDG